jgi:bifunctional NMN adenylyltransferase/nudix hydrolase
VYDIVTYIGRFQPFHLGHLSVLKQALLLAKEVVVVVGSAYSSRDIRNPFSFEERKEMILSSIEDVSDRNRVKVVPVRDYRYNNQKWITAVQSVVGATTRWYDNPIIGLIGHSKDATSSYLKMFPNWYSIEAKNYNNINATDIRNFVLDTHWNTKRLFDAMPMQSVRVMSDVLYDDVGAPTDIGDVLFTEFDTVKKYKKAWEKAPYPPTFVTVDSVVVQSGHILLVKRKAYPGKGLWALPGGFVNQQETLLDASVRELKEETRLKVPVPVLKGSVKAQHTFDDPNRSTRGRTITTAFYFELGDSDSLPRVVGADDAEKAAWVPLSKINPCDMYEDHYDIIDFFVGM